ncbi:MAG: SAM-dependent methyltransferase [Boseongicola sp.]|nr:SAM-dependent methyltransferase [Boseongicola sp.]
MTPLTIWIEKRIRADGPMTVAEFMTTCLSHPDHGYYTTRDPLGQAGDFVTAPEISQMFGELVGLSIAQAWMDQGSPSPFNLVELGPGRGTLMADILRATKSVPGFQDGAKVHLVEHSTVLRRVQKETIQAPIAHHDLFEEVPDGPTFLIANEFFDALPVRQFVRDGAFWRERVVGLENDALAFGLTDPTPMQALDHRLQDTKDGDLVEHCASAQAIVADIGRRIASFGGAALIIDYGDWRSLGDTLQCVKDHRTADPLLTLGEADLTTHVDFEALAREAAPASFSRLTPQGIFLERLGITDRANSLAHGMSGTALETHVAAHRRLTHPNEMGTLFKVLALYPSDSIPPPGVGV